MLRKLLAIALLALFGLPFALSLLALAPTSEANLPVCCRRDGAHHCTMPLTGQALSDELRFTAPPLKCPFAPANTPPGRAFGLAGIPAGGAVFAGLLSYPAVYPQTLARARISRVRSNQKRGPPTS